MTLYDTIKTTLDGLSISSAVAVWKQDPAPATYCVITPIGNEYVMADDAPIFNIPEARITLYTKNNYIATKNSITSAMLTAGAHITEMTYLGYDDESGYHSFAIGVECAENMEA